MRDLPSSGTVELASGSVLAFNVLGPLGLHRDAPPLLLLPSLGGGSECWGDFRLSLSLDRATIALDPRGFGRSSSEPPVVTTRNMAREVREFAGRLRLETLHVFGSSLGSLVASWLAIDAPLLVTRLVLAGSAARGADYAPRDALRALRRAGVLSAAAASLPAEYEEAPDDDEPSGVRPRPLPSSDPDSWPRLRVLRFLLAAVAHGPGERLQRIAARTLLLWGEHDSIVRERARRRLRLSLPYAEAEVVPGAGHDLTRDAPAFVAHRVLDFLRASPEYDVRGLFASEP